MRSRKVGPVLVSDFDDTIVSPDTGRVIMDKFADGDWQALDRLYNSNEMPIEEVLRRQFLMVRATKNSMIEEIEKSVSFRPGFGELVEACSEGGIPIVVASYGLDFCIEHFLKEAGLRRQVKVCAPRSRLGPHGISLVFPKPRLRGSINLKHDLVRQYKQNGRKVVYVGDGTSDFPAVRVADVRFVIQGSVLAGLCKRDKIHHSQIVSFDSVTRSLQSL